MKRFAEILKGFDLLGPSPIALTSWLVVAALVVVVATPSWTAVAALGCLVAARSVEQYLATKNNRHARAVGAKLDIHQTTVRSESEKAMRTLAEAVEKRLAGVEQNVSKLQTEVAKPGFASVVGRRHG